MTAVKNIPFFEYPKLYSENKENILKIIDEVCGKGAFILQKELIEFERNICLYLGGKYAVGVGNATDGLELSWMAAGLSPGDEVICSAHTMVATASSIVTAGGIPVPVDIGVDNLIDPVAIEEAITSRTVGIMPTHLNGRTCDMEKIMNLAAKKNLVVVEDAAQALGSRFKNRSAGTFGLASAISFYPAKVLGCFGDGGIVITSNDQAYDKIYQLHDHGRAIDGVVKSWGRNSRLDNLQAAILNYQFENYDSVVSRRRHIASIYHNRLSLLEELKLPPPPVNDGDNYDIYQNYELQAKRRDELKDFLREKGVGTLIQWGGKALHQWGHLGFKAKLPKVEKFFTECIMFPINMFISDDDVNYICDSVISFYRH